MNVNLFEDHNDLNILGLEYIPEFISSEEEALLIQKTDERVWTNQLKRRVQHYGYLYNYQNRRISFSDKIGEIPDFMSGIKLKIEKLIVSNFDQLIINEYDPGQGISSHVDCIPCFENKIAILSTVSGCNMLFKNGDQKKQIYLAPRSLLILSDEGRYLWQHQINSVKSDIVGGYRIPRKRRVSFTFRKVIIETSIS